MDEQDYVEANRKQWNSRAPLHEEAKGEELRQRVQSPGFCTFDEVEVRLFAEIGLAGKAVVQLACNNGQELIAVKKAGAGRCVGFDISDGFIEQARELTALSGVEVEFVRCNVYEIPPEFNSCFDVAYVTIGALTWLPDLDRFFGVVARLLKSGGCLFIYEMHPILDMFEPDAGTEIRYSYFDLGPRREIVETDYLNPNVVLTDEAYWFPHRVCDIIGGCLKHGLSLTHFEEYPHDISLVFRGFESHEKRLPLSYSLIARKQGSGRRR